MFSFLEAMGYKIINKPEMYSAEGSFCCTYIHTHTITRVTKYNVWMVLLCISELMKTMRSARAEAFSS